MGVYIENLTNGKYGLRTDSYLKFEIDTQNNRQELMIDKKSALEIAYTLIDSLGMLDKNAEELICNMQEKIHNL